MQTGIYGREIIRRGFRDWVAQYIILVNQISEGWIIGAFSIANNTVPGHPETI